MPGGRIAIVSHKEKSSRVWVRLLSLFFEKLGQAEGTNEESVDAIAPGRMTSRSCVGCGDRAFNGVDGEYYPLYGEDRVESLHGKAQKYPSAQISQLQPQSSGDEDCRDTFEWAAEVSIEARCHFLGEPPRLASLVLLVRRVSSLLLRKSQAATPVTMELPEESGIEPDYCFYIDWWEAVSGKERIDWRRDPPPDLVLEIDVTSYSDTQDYLPYRVPEVWLFRKQQRLIHQFQGNAYCNSFEK